MRLERFYENTEILHVNTEPDRCYYLPCDAAGNSEQILLNGVWSFQYFPSVAEAEDFLRSEFDPKKMDKIPVPSCWQFHGYDRHQYVNLFYPIPYDPFISSVLAGCLINFIPFRTCRFAPGNTHCIFCTAAI